MWVLMICRNEIENDFRNHTYKTYDENDDSNYDNDADTIYITSNSDNDIEDDNAGNYLI